jgi:hypothetical protein
MAINVIVPMCILSSSQSWSCDVTLSLLLHLPELQATRERSRSKHGIQTGKHHGPHTSQHTSTTKQPATNKEAA